MGLRGPVTEDQLGDLAKIQRSQRHLLEIINDLLNFSRIEAGRVEYEIERVPLRESIQTVAVMLLPQAAEKQIELSSGSCAAGLAALADRVKVEQIILNLCTNAIKFTEAAGHVEVACDDRGERVAVVVRDTGIGIPAEDMERVFDPFVQLGRGLTTQHEGTGLGLAISRDLARAMGGDLVLESEVGRGSTFTLTLPAA
jgi:signal transduction histidine kinase